MAYNLTETLVQSFSTEQTLHAAILRVNQKTRGNAPPGVQTTMCHICCSNDCDVKCLVRRFVLALCPWRRWRKLNLHLFLCTFWGPRDLNLFFLITFDASCMCNIRPCEGHQCHCASCNVCSEVWQVMSFVLAQSCDPQLLCLMLDVVLD